MTTTSTMNATSTIRTTTLTQSTESHIPMSGSLMINCQLLKTIQLNIAAGAPIKCTFECQKINDLFEQIKVFGQLFLQLRSLGGNVEGYFQVKHAGNKWSFTMNWQQTEPKWRLEMTGSVAEEMPKSQKLYSGDTDSILKLGSFFYRFKSTNLSQEWHPDINTAGLEALKQVNH